MSETITQPGTAAARDCQSETKLRCCPGLWHVQYVQSGQFTQGSCQGIWHLEIQTADWGGSSKEEEEAPMS